MIVTDKYVIFWKGWLSNFKYSPFIDPNTDIAFSCAEQYFMWKKAMTFNDKEVAEKILKTSIPQEAKNLGRQVRGYDDMVWNNLRYDVMKQGNLMKYTQNPELKELLMDSRFDGKLFVEANPYDTIWAVGCWEEDAVDPLNWKGLNLLGKVIGEVRYEIQNN